LDAHALSVVAHAIDELSGAVSRARLCPDHVEIVGWLHQLRAPVRVATAFGNVNADVLARFDDLVRPGRLRRHNPRQQLARMRAR
jgi:transposase